MERNIEISSQDVCFFEQKFRGGLSQFGLQLVQNVQPAKSVNIHIMHKDNKTWNNIYGEPTENGYPRLEDAHLYHRTIASQGIL
jgi:hypothetical protein